MERTFLSFGSICPFYRAIPRLLFNKRAHKGKSLSCPSGRTQATGKFISMMPFQACQSFGTAMLGTTQIRYPKLGPALGSLSSERQEDIEIQYSEASI